MTHERQPRLGPDDLDPAQQKLYRSITDGPRSGGPFPLVDDSGVLQGPFGGFLLSPAVGEALQRLGAAIRYETSLTPRMRELAVLVVAAHHRSPFERYAHEAVGRAAGLTDQELRAVDEGGAVPLDDAHETAVVELVRALLEGDIDDPLWERWAPVLGVPAVFELIALVGYYSTLALQMRVLRTDGAGTDRAPSAPSADRVTP
jgi:4-carboxymuconolactone decarboxylase